ncbi:MAG: hypothetical protein HYZ18_03805 [Pseudogulbenkiania sp.]|nr:hypothetical protein [Pseudogulbenkiania sp.]
MHPVLTALETELRQLAAAAQSASGDDRAINIVHNNWSFAGVDRHELGELAIRLADRIASEGGDELTVNEALLSQYPQRLQYLRDNTVPNLLNGNASQAVSAYVITLESLERAMAPALTVDPVKVAADVKTAKDLRSKLRGLGSRVEELEPKVDALQEMANQIVQAHAAADQLPTDLATLREAREEIQSLRGLAAKDHDGARKLFEQMQEWDAKLQASAEAAEGTIARCEDAMRASTSLGLAGAFHDQAKQLTRSMVYWVVGLIGALGAGMYFGGQQLHGLSEAIQSTTPTMIVWTRLFLSLLSVGAPVWFAWLATKQIGQRFRLAEDYAYKASISRAYEGYRREAMQLDEDFQTKLFASALARLDEQPLRFVEHETHGSPWHELLSSDVVKEALRITPELGGRFTEIARETIAAAKSQKVASKAKDKGELEAEGHEGDH